MAASATVTVLRPKLRAGRPFEAQPPAALKGPPTPPRGEAAPLPGALSAGLLVGGGCVVGMLIAALWLRDVSAGGVAAGAAIALVAAGTRVRRALDRR